MDAHPQLIYLIILKMVFIQKIKFRQTIQLHNQNQNHGKNTTKLHKKTLSKDRQEFINNISGSGFKQFQA